MNQSINQSSVTYNQQISYIQSYICCSLSFLSLVCRSSKFSPLSALHTFWLTFYCFMWELIKLPYKTEGHSLIKTSLTVEANCSLSPGYSWPTCHKLRRGTVGYKELRSDPQYAGQVAHQLWNVKGKAAALSTFVASDASWY